MIIDKVDGQNIPRYLVYDVVTFEGFDIGTQPFYPNRLMLIEVSTKCFKYIIIVTMVPASRNETRWYCTLARDLL